ncbi:MAG: TAXI family TRAP transporter solute-binding subunit [Bauldia litoralis]
MWRSETVSTIGSRARTLALVAGAAAIVAAAPSAMTPVRAANDIVIGSKEPGSSFYTYAAALADVLSKHSGKTGKVLSVAGAGVFLPMMENREADLGLVSHYEGWLAKNGKKPFAKPFDVQLVLVGGGFHVGLYVRNDSPIKSRNEIKGKRIAYKYSGTPGIHVYAQAEIANVGLDWKDLKPVPRTSLYAGQRDDVKEKRLEVFYASVGSGVTRELDSTVGIRFLGLDTSPAAIARMKKVYPVVISKVKAGPPGIREDMTLVKLPVYVISHKKVSADTVYLALKTMWDHNDALMKASKRTKSWTRDNFADDQATLPYHAGAVRFFKEKGVWTKAMEANQAALLSGK